MRIVLCLLLFSALLSSQEGGPESAKPSPIPSAEKNKLTALLPAPPGFGGDSKGPAKFYSTDLSRYVAHGADAYLDCGLVAMVHREFKSGNVELAVDIYDMGDPLHAFGIYSAERSPDDLVIPMGAEGHVDIGVLDFLQAGFYVKLQATGDPERTPSVLESAAKNIVGRIGPEGTVPQPVAWFPTTGLAGNSMKYIVKAPMGYDFLAPATTVIYRIDAKPTTVLASLAPSAGDAAARLGKLKEHSPAAAAIAGLPGEAWRSGDVIFFARGRYVIVVQNPPAKPDALLKELYSAVKE